ncbi:MAG TPA: mechanosensitive ion channel domain-containing protein [Sphingomonas sp.]|jgi:small-conductance mechanosensitive channel
MDPADLKLTLPNRAETIEIAIAGGFILLALMAGLFAGRYLGPRLAALWRRHIGHHGEGVGDRIHAIVRHGITALLLAIVEAAHDWTPWAGAPLGFTLGLAAAFAVYQFLRGLGLARWMGWLTAAVLFVALFSRALGGLAPIRRTLDRFGFSVGTYQFTLLTLVTALVTLVLLLATVRLANRVVDRAIGRARGLDPTQRVLGQKLAGIAILIVAFFVGIDLLGIDLTAFAVFSGALGLAVGFGLQKTFGNLIAGIILLWDRSIKPGDVIVVGDSFGQVTKIGVRAVSVVTRDGKEHLIPNENLMTQEVENWSYSDKNVRVRIPVGVSYDCDLDLAQRLMLQAANDSERVLNDPKPSVWLTAFGESSVDHEILAWINDPEGGVGNVRSDVLNRLWRLFKEHGIEIPYPQRDIRVRSLPEPPPPS